MSKSTHFFGQSVFGQLISLIDRTDVQKIVQNSGSDRYCKGFTTWNHLVTMLFCSAGDCNSIREVVGAFLGLKGKTEHLGLTRLPKRSTLSDANKHRSPLIFEQIYYSLLRRYNDRISDSRFKKQFGKPVEILDSTTISLFQAILRCVGRKPANGKSKGGVKVHVRLNADTFVPSFLWYSDAATHDNDFCSKIDFKSDVLYVFDKGYTDHWRYDEWSKKGIHFVTRIRENVTYETLQELEIDDAIDPGVIKDEWIQVPLRKNGQIISTTRLRRTAYWDTQHNRLLVFLSNIDEMNAEQIASLYKVRWKIELLFKQLKQNFPLKYFLGDNENAITIQIWCALIVNLLFTIIQKTITKRKWSFSNITSFIRLHLFNNIHLIRFLENPEKDWIKALEFNSPNLFSG